MHPFAKLAGREDLTLEQIAGKMRCERCGNRPKLIGPWRQSDAPGYAKSWR